MTVVVDEHDLASGCFDVTQVLEAAIDASKISQCINNGFIADLQLVGHSNRCQRIADVVHAR